MDLKTKKFIYLLCFAIKISILDIEGGFMKRRKKEYKVKKKILISLDKEIYDRLTNFVKMCDNKSINKSIVIEDSLEYALKRKRIRDYLFPED